MITITFDDAINNNNIDLYREMFNGKRKNPNGCDIKATVSKIHEFCCKNDYKMLLFSISSHINTQTIALLLILIAEAMKSPSIQSRENFLFAISM